ncbi:MAG TPA: hypothetical protein VJY39_07205 [Acidisphaera sp.]|nr:hypothetical protein [Acidisphaera sp.]
MPGETNRVAGCTPRRSPSTRIAWHGGCGRARGMDRQAVESGDDSSSGQADSQPRAAARRPSRYLRIKRRVRQAALILAGMWGFGLRLGGAVTATILLVLLVLEVTANQTEIQPIAVPKSLDESGLTSEVAARRLRDEIAVLTETAASGGAEAPAIAMHGDAPDVVVPTVGVSVASLVSFVQHFLGVRLRNTIDGELVGTDQSLVLVLRLNGQLIFRSKPQAADKLAQLWADGADAVMREVRPYQAAMALYARDPKAATDLANDIVQRYRKDDENGAWARLLIGLREVDLWQYSAAAREFTSVARMADRASLPPPLSWFGAPPPYAWVAHHDLGLTLLYQGQTSAAMEELREALRLKPDESFAHNVLGLAMRQLSMHAEAERQMSQARAIFDRKFAGLADETAHGPGSARLHVFYGIMLELQSRLDTALAQFRWAAELDPDGDYPQRAWCYGLIAVHRYDEAADKCAVAAAKAPETAANQIALAEALWLRNDLQQKDRERARRSADEAIRLAPEMPSYRVQLGNMLLIETQYTGTADAYRVAVALASEQPLAYAGLINALRREAEAADSDASRTPLLAEACRVLDEGLQHVPPTAPSRDLMTTAGLLLTASAGCTTPTPPGH